MMDATLFGVKRRNRFPLPSVLVPVLVPLCRACIPIQDWGKPSYYERIDTRAVKTEPAAPSSSSARPKTAHALS